MLPKMEQTYLIKLAAGEGAGLFHRIQDVLRDCGARIIAVGQDRAWMIAALDHQCSEKVRRIPGVDSVGGVTLKKREVKVFRVPSTSRAG
jgi:hypothetical protein